MGPSLCLQRMDCPICRAARFGITRHLPGVGDISVCLRCGSSIARGLSLPAWASYRKGEIAVAKRHYRFWIKFYAEDSSPATADRQRVLRGEASVLDARSVRPRLRPVFEL